MLRRSLWLRLAYASLGLRVGLSCGRSRSSPRQSPREAPPERAGRDHTFLHMSCSSLPIQGRPRQSERGAATPSCFACFLPFPPLLGRPRQGAMRQANLKEDVCSEKRTSSRMSQATRARVRGCLKRNEHVAEDVSSETDHLLGPPLLLLPSRSFSGPSRTSSHRAPRAP